jgi:hypothetical protein
MSIAPTVCETTATVCETTATVCETTATVWETTATVWETIVSIWETVVAATEVAATEVAATEVAATEVATEVAATEVAATEVAATEVAATEVAKLHCGLASKDEIERSLDAMIKVCEIKVCEIQFSEFIKNHAKKCRRMEEFDKIKKRLLSFANQVEILIKTWNESLPKKLSAKKLSAKKLSVKKSGKIASNFNKTLNLFRGILLPDSIFNEICFMNEQLKHLAKTQPKVRERFNMFEPDELIDSEKSPFVVKLRCTGPNVLQKDPTGIRVPFDTVLDLLIALESFLDKTGLENIVQKDLNMFKPVPNDIFGNFGCIVIGPYVLTLRIFFANGKYVDSNDPKLLHMLYDNNPPHRKDIKDAKNLKKKPDYFKPLFPHVVKFNLLVVRAFKRIIDYQYNIKDFKFTVVTCCRREPTICDGITFGFKPEHNPLQPHRQHRRKLLKCAKCSLELCTGHGCKHGIYHGATECELSIDEISELAIAADSKRCPGCIAPVFKPSGCNHMTCICGVHFCWICSQELPKDVNDQYSTSMHYRPNAYGIGDPSSRCNQFD